MQQQQAWRPDSSSVAACDVDMRGGQASYLVPNWGKCSACACTRNNSALQLQNRSSNNLDKTCKCVLNQLRIRFLKRTTHP